MDASRGEGRANAPVQFARSIAPERHCALFYEDPSYALRVEFGFMEGGLEKGERCFYLTHSEDESHTVEAKMRERRELRAGMTKGLLATYADSFIPQSPEEVGGLFDERRRRMEEGASGPYRVVGTVLSEIATPYQSATQTEIDFTIQRQIQGSGATYLCSFSSDKVEGSLRNDWFLKTVATHHSAIFAPRRGEGIAFDMR